MSTRVLGIHIFTHTDEGELVSNVTRVRLRWVGEGMTKGDNVKLKDTSGNVIWEAVALDTVVNEEGLLLLRESITLEVDTLDSGTLYMYPC